jgi:uncharacterized membrane protein YgaE (UPF0421/DUF939 family)
MATARNHAAQAADVLSGLGQKGALRLVDRVRRLRASLLIALQAGLAAGIAWYVATELFSHQRPFFAPIAAVVVLGVSVGRRLRRAVELCAGVALGILVGDTLIYFIGTGPWQIALVVILAILTAVFMGGSVTVIGQAASSAVLVATLKPPSTGIYYGRFLDALIGGTVGVLVMALLLPLNPLTTIKKAAGPALDLLASELERTADAFAARDEAMAREALQQIRATEPDLARFRDALTAASETASLAPVRWRSRAPLAVYADAITHIDRAIRNGRVLVRRAVLALADKEDIDDELIASLRTMAQAVRALRSELADSVEPTTTRELALAAVGEAGDAYRAGLGFSADVVVAQLRSIAHDLLRASGLDESTSIRAVRRAVGRLAT